MIITRLVVSHSGVLFPKLLVAVLFLADQLANVCSAVNRTHRCSNV